MYVCMHVYACICLLSCLVPSIFDLIDVFKMYSISVLVEESLGFRIICLCRPSNLWEPKTLRF